jgi:hypothetical protein
LLESIVGHHWDATTPIVSQQWDQTSPIYGTHSCAKMGTHIELEQKRSKVIFGRHRSTMSWAHISARLA